MNFKLDKRIADDRTTWREAFESENPGVTPKDFYIQDYPFLSNSLDDIRQKMESREARAAVYRDRYMISKTATGGAIQIAINYDKPTYVLGVVAANGKIRPFHSSPVDLSWAEVVEEIEAAEAAGEIGEGEK